MPWNLRARTFLTDSGGHVSRAGAASRRTGTAGRLENAQVAVYLSYATRRGHALIDGTLYLLRSWTDDAERRRGEGVADGFGVRDQVVPDSDHHRGGRIRRARWVGGRRRVSAAPMACCARRCASTSPAVSELRRLFDAAACLSRRCQSALGCSQDRPGCLPRA